MVGVLDAVLAHHSVGVGDVVATSSPVHVQALDIVSVDGQPVGPDNFAARDLVTELAALDRGVRPDEIGTPWPIQSPGFFSDQSSQASLHLAFEMPGVNAEPAAVGAGRGPGRSGPGRGPGRGARRSRSRALSRARCPAHRSQAPLPRTRPPRTRRAATPPLPIPPPPLPARPCPGPFPRAAAAPAAGAAPGGSAVDQAQQLAGTGSPLPLSADPAAGAKISAMVHFADSAVGKPYIYGGGHGDWSPQPGYDCSGFVSAVLHAAGYLTHPVDTTAMPSQPGIEAGPGKFVTIFDRALSGHDGHVIIEINGQFYESGGMHGAWGGGGGVEKIGRPSDSYLKTFPNVLHPQGL